MWKSLVTYGVLEAQNAAADTELAVVLQTTRTYLSAIYGKENVKINQESLKSYQEHLSQAQKLRKEGVATDYDVIRAEAAVEDQRKRLADVSNQYELALANLRTALILPKDALINLQGGFFEIPTQQEVTQAEEGAVQAAPLLRSIENRASSLLWAEKSIRAEAKPQLDVVGFGNLIPRSSGFPPLLPSRSIIPMTLTTIPMRLAFLAASMGDMPIFDLPSVMTIICCISPE
jgi:outer membrane protein TolC